MSDAVTVTSTDAPPMDEPPSNRRRRAGWTMAAALVVIVLGWIVLLPPSAGSDEPGHVVRSAALVRGQLEDEGFLDVVFSGSFELPAWVGWPEPECWAFKLDVPVSCSTLLDEPTGTELRGTKAADYPVWGHLLPGVPTLLVDDAVGNRLARVTHAIVPLALVIASLLLAARRSRIAAVGVVLAITPVVLFNTATVNPSGLVIAGGIGVWTVLAIGPPRAGPPDRLTAWLAAGAWAAMVLPRRDGLVYAAVILAIVIAVGMWKPADVRRLLGPAQLAVVVIATLATLTWAVTSDSSGSMLLLAVPLLPVATWAIRAALDRTGWSRWVVGGVLAAGAALAALVGVLWVQRRDPALDTVKWRNIVAETGDDLFEAIGVLGWLDAPMPASLLFAFLLALGALVGAVALAEPRRLIAPAVTLLVGVLMSWWLTASQVGGSPEYWQGRYYLPLLVGIPIVLGTAEGVAGFDRIAGLARGLAVVAGVVSVVALGAAMRRFAVGIDGTMAPWRWHTFGAAVSPLFPLLLVVGAWAVFLWSLDRLAGEPPAVAVPSDPPAVPAEATTG